MVNNDLVSIAMATYNGELFLREQLDSIIAQDYENIELVVCDDCSEDGTVAILGEYKSKIRLNIVVNDERLGFLANFEKAISLCEGEFIALCDQDDVWKADKISVLVSLLAENMLIHGDCELVGEDGRVVRGSWKRQLGSYVRFENLLFANVVTGCTVLFRKELLGLALPFPHGLVYHDWWLAICAAKLDSITYTERCLVQYRQHGEQDTGSGERGGEGVWFLLRQLIAQVSRRFVKKKSRRFVGYQMHLRQVEALKRDARLVSYNAEVVDDAIEYMGDYLEHQVHLRSFVIGLKRSNIVYPENNCCFAKNFIRDIVG